MEKEYKVIDGTSYPTSTRETVIAWLETSRTRHQRIRIFYGKDGKCWNEENDVIGHVGRSAGTKKIPILIHSSRSMGGPAILTDCIVRIDTKGSDGKIVTVYKDPTTHFDTFVNTAIGTVYNETQDVLYARCKSGDAGQRLADFMNGKRWNK
jgi:hypothetical protein